MGKFILVLLLGWSGIHKFIEKKTVLGTIYLFTLGLFGIGWLIDIVLAFKAMNTQTISNDMQLVFSNDFMIVGAQYECRKNKKEMRQNIIKKMRPGMHVHVEKYSYNGSPAYMIVDPKSKMDLGVLSQGAADWITRDYPNAKIEGILTEKHNDTFKVKVCVYK